MIETNAGRDLTTEPTRSDWDMELQDRTPESVLSRFLREGFDGAEARPILAKISGIDHLGVEVDDIAAGNIIWKPKVKWPELMVIMQQRSTTQTA